MAARPRGGGSRPLGAPVSDALEQAMARHPPPVAAHDAELTLAIDAEEMRMLEIFHRSFNLPGLRLGLVKPVISEDYYPPDEDDFEPDPDEEEAAAPPPARAAPAAAAAPRRQRAPAYQEPDRAAELNALLAQTKGLRLEVDQTLAGEVADEVVEEAIELEGATAPGAGAHQRQVRAQRPSSGSRPHSAAGSRPQSAAGSKPPSAAGRPRPSRW